ncbi:MAG: prepilin-type N-terminal cleavage/methylation domain-containing protein [Candidatus Saccharimonadales bacterium]
MSRRNEQGFTLNELLVVILVSSILIITLFSFTSSTVNSFMRLQAEGLANSKLAEGSFRVARVLRGANHIETANEDTITAYAYFSPQDAYTSKIRYYLNGTQDKLMAEVIPMTADYPIGSLIVAQTKNVVIIEGFYKRSGYPTFVYYNSSYSAIASPVTDLQAIKNMTVNLYAKLYQSNNQVFTSSSVSVNLRNRKTNL